MAPQAYKAWSSVMGESQLLHCAWHVDKALRENIQRLVKNSESRAETYKMVRTLMVETHAPTFEATKPYVVLQLKQNENTSDFAEYFEVYYGKNAKHWAYCYRINCGINTNMSLERMHGILKHAYLNGKKNKRLDTAVQALLHMLDDRRIDRLLSLSKGKYTHKLAVLRKRHDNSEQLTGQCFDISPNREWTVQSSSDLQEVFNVTRSESNCNKCNFNLRCVECNSCIHEYFCTCPDYTIRYNMCKHIHYVCTKYPIEVSCEEAASGQILIIDEDHHHTRDQVESDAHIAQLSRALTKNADNHRRKSTYRY